MTRAEKRRLHRLANPIVHSNVRALRLMVDGSLMTVPRAMESLDVELQTARNCLCKLVHTKHAVIVTPKAPGRPATYRITEEGRTFLAETEEKLSPPPGASSEQEIEEAERRALARRAEANVQRALSLVPNSVFALGRLASAHIEGATA